MQTLNFQKFWTFSTIKSYSEGAS